MAQKRKFTASRKVTIGAKQFRKWDEWTEGEVITGKFIQKYTDKTYDKECYVIQVEDASFKMNKKDITGTNLVLNSCGMLDKAMEQVVVGEYVQIEYMGKSKIESGPMKGKMSHAMDVIVVTPDDGGNSDSDEEEVTDDDL